MQDQQNVKFLCLFAGLRIRIRMDLYNFMKMNRDPDQHYFNLTTVQDPFSDLHKNVKSTRVRIEVKR